MANGQTNLPIKKSSNRRMKGEYLESDLEIYRGTIGTFRKASKAAA